MGYLGYYGAIAASANWMGRLWLTLQEGIAGMHRVFTILESDYEQVDEDDSQTQATNAFSMHIGIELRHVGYQYPDGTTALHDINFEGRVGELVVLAGPTGAGKTTLAYLIPDLLTPTQGE